MNHTPGPWQWSFSGGSFYLRTVGRGLLTVMDFARMGMQRGQPRFAKWEGDERGRMGGVMFKADELGELHDHPDARLIAFAPEILKALKDLVHDIETDEGVDTSAWPLLDEAKKVIAAVENKANITTSESK